MAKVTVKCNYCGKLFQKIPSQAKRHTNHYCNIECYNKFNTSLFDEELILSLYEMGLYDYIIARVTKHNRSTITKYLQKYIDIDRRSKIDDPTLRQRLSIANRGTRTGPNNHKWKGDSTYIFI